MTRLKDERVRKLALCEVELVVIRPNTPYLFEATPGCKRCRELLEKANDSYGSEDFSYDFANPKTADIPIYATTAAIKLPKAKAKKG